MTASTLWTFLESLARETSDPGTSVTFRREDNSSLRIDVIWSQNGRKASYAHLLDVTDVLNYTLPDMQQQAMLSKIRARLDAAFLSL